MKKYLSIIISVFILSSAINLQSQNLNPTSYISLPGSSDTFKAGYTFSYVTSGTPWSGALISYGGFPINNYDTQISSDYGPNGGNHISYRTKNGDTNSWNNWNELATRGTNKFIGDQYISGNVGIGIVIPETLLNVNVGSGGLNGIAGIRVGGLSNYSRLEFGIDGDYDGMIRSFGNNINYYAGHWKTKGAIASENHSHNWFTSKNGSSDWSSVKMTLNQDGNLGIGTTNPTSKLTVAGDINSREVRVTVNAGADFVFEKDYNLPSLDSVSTFIKENKHLPEITSAEQMKIDGINLSEMNIKLLQKIEEITLYLIEMKKENEEIKKSQIILESRMNLNEGKN